MTTKLRHSTNWYRDTLAQDVREAGQPNVAHDIKALADEVDRLTLELSDAEQEGYAAGQLDAEAAKEREWTPVRGGS